MEKRPPAKQVSTARNFLACVIQEQRAAADELRATARELEMIIEELLASRAELRAPLSEAPPEAEPEDPVAARARATAVTYLTGAQLKREADRVLQKGREAIRESVALRNRSRRLRSLLRKGGGPKAPASSLSNRERQVLALIVAGKSSKEIAADLGISFKTAVTHRASIMGKLDVHEIASVVREAILRGLV